MTCRKADRFRSAFATRCAWPPEINAARTYVLTKRSSALLTAALRRQRSHVRIVSGPPDFPGKSGAPEEIRTPDPQTRSTFRKNPRFAIGLVAEPHAGLFKNLSQMRSTPTNAP